MPVYRYENPSGYVTDKALLESHFKKVADCCLKKEAMRLSISNSWNLNYKKKNRYELLSGSITSYESSCLDILLNLFFLPAIWLPHGRPLAILKGAASLT